MKKIFVNFGRIFDNMYECPRPLVTFEYIVTSTQSISVWLTMMVVIAKGIGRKISREWGKRKTMTKNSVNKPSSICPFYQWA